MPSPVGHSLLGVACTLVWASSRKGGAWALGLFFLVLAACIPDIDLVWGLFAGALNRFHRMGTHSVTFAFMSASLIWLMWRRADVSLGIREWFFLLLAAGSHLLADWLSIDPAPPHGIMLLWPFSETYTMSSRAIFPPLSKDSVADIFQWNNVVPVLMEMVYIAPLLLVSGIWALRGRWVSVVEK